MNLKRIIKEEMDDLQWIKDIKSNQDIAQEIADESEIKKNQLLYTPFALPSFIPFPAFPSSYPFPPSSLSSFKKYCKEQYGLNDDDIKNKINNITDIWKRYKELIKDKINNHNNLNESDGLQWIKNVKSNQDIAQDIADNTEIKNNLLHTPFTLPILSSATLLFLFFSFKKYCKEQYGLTKKEIQDVWKRYKKLIKDKINNLNESNDMEWVRDTTPTLNDYVDAKILNIGDIIYLNGRAQNNNGNDIMVNNIPFIVKRTYKPSDIKYSSGLDCIRYYDIGYLHIEDASDNIFKVDDLDSFGLVEEDGYLNVTKHIPYKEDGNNTWDMGDNIYLSQLVENINNVGGVLNESEDKNIKRIIKEEIDDLDWIRNATINFEDVNLRVGDMFRVPTLNPDGSTFSIVTIIDIGLRGNEPITYRRESGMGQLQQRNLVDRKVDFIKRIIKDKWEPFYHNRGFKLYESDFDWVGKTSSKDSFNIEDFYGVPFYELHDDGEPKTWRGIPSKFYIKDVGDSTVVQVCKQEDGDKDEMCSTYGKGGVVSMFTRGDWVFVYEYMDNLNESDDLDWIGDG